VIRFGLRLALGSGREALVRLLVTAGAVALGVGLLLTTLAALNGASAQNDRYAWLNSGIAGVTSPGVKAAPDPLWGALQTDDFDGRSITQVDVAATGPQSPVLPGLAQVPRPGQYDASPALAALLRSVPADELADRLPGRPAAELGDAALPSPDSLIVVVGLTPAQMSRIPGAIELDRIATVNPGDCGACRAGDNTNGVELVLSVVSAAVLFPVLVFIGTATRMAAARREQRFAAMRLVGATPRQVSVIAAVESTAAAVAGTGVGFALFYAARVPLAGFPFTGERLFTSDLALTAPDILVVALGIPLAAAVAARIALRRVRISPLGVSRQVAPRPPRAYRVLPLVAGVAELGYFVGRRPPTTNGQIEAFLPGILLMLTGLVAAGPWLTMACSRLLARRAKRPAALIAARAACWASVSAGTERCGAPGALSFQPPE
jgi:hypothetical protein